MGRRTSIAEKYGKKKQEQEHEVVVQAETVPTVSEEAEEKAKALKAKAKDKMVKVDNKGVARVTPQEVAMANPDFEGIGGGGGFFVSKSGDKFKITHPDLDEPAIVPTLKCVLLGRKICYTVGDETTLIKSYDKVNTTDGRDFMEEASRFKDKPRFRTELTIGLEDFDEPVELMTSGTGFYRLNEYAKKLLDPKTEKGGEKCKLNVNEVVTEISLEVVTDKNGTYIVERFDFVEVL